MAKTECLTDARDQKNEASAEYSLAVRWPPAESIVPLRSCLNACKAVAATDLNGDGIDEFILGASSTLFQVYELADREALGQPATVARPGAPPHWAADRPADLRLFSSQFHYDAFGCDFIKDRVIVLNVAFKPDQGVWGEWKIHETLLQFETTQTPPFGQFTVISERDYSEPYEENVGAAERFDAGDPCWD
ncbi:MAG: FG-GAP repeat protein [Actinomycetota bacterium]